MPGIYIHIPFCKQACHYCDFHFSTSQRYKTELLDALCREISLREKYLEDKNIQTIYFGGGTPSLLAAEEIRMIIDCIATHFDVSSDAEITLEANPDDLNADKLKALKQSPVNRFSIGIQSFFEEDLLWMNRSHNAAEAEASIKRTQDAGFENITCDLIYGYPLLSNQKWLHNIYQLTELQIPHISCYSMTVEQGTALHHFVQKGNQGPMNDGQSAEQFKLLMSELQALGYLHYEISNFALPGCESRHNSNYWKGESYLGIGPSAHSFNGQSRQWNVAHNIKYLEAISKDALPAELEILSLQNRFNEYVMTSLRTCWGLDLQKVQADFGTGFEDHILRKVEVLAGSNWLNLDKQKLTLTAEGKLFADHIAAELFIIDDE